MDPSLVVSWVAAGIIGFLQPFAQEIVTRGKFVGRPATWVTMGVSLLGGAVAVWITGGFALVHLPAFTLADPSPLLFFVLDQTAKIALVARLTYAIPGIGATPATVAVTPATPATVASPGSVGTIAQAATATIVDPGKPGLVQKVAGTTDAPVATVPPA